MFPGGKSHRQHTFLTLRGVPVISVLVYTFWQARISTSMLAIGTWMEIILPSSAGSEFCSIYWLPVCPDVNVADYVCGLTNPIYG